MIVILVACCNVLFIIVFNIILCGCVAFLHMFVVRDDDVFLTFLDTRAPVDETGDGDVAMATVAVVEHSFGIVLWLADEEAFHVGVNDCGRWLAPCSGRVEYDTGCLTPAWWR